MALPIERRNGNTTTVPAPRIEAPAPGADLPVVEDLTGEVDPPVVPTPVGGAVAVVDPVLAVEVDQARTGVPVPAWVRGVTTLAVVLVALVAAVVSYEYMRAMADLAGEGWRSRLLPISVADAQEWPGGAGATEDEEQLPDGGHEPARGRWSGGSPPGVRGAGRRPGVRTLGGGMVVRAQASKYARRAGVVSELGKLVGVEGRKWKRYFGPG